MIGHTKLGLALLLGSAFCLGCDAKTETGTPNSGTPASGTTPSGTTGGGGGVVDTAPPPTVDLHAHPTEGPHHGELIELGNEEYHAELLHDDKSVTIYVLDAKATTLVPIDATEVKINLKHDGTPEQFTLVAQPDETDPAGKSSRFVSQDAELAGHLEEESTEPRLVLTINGQQFNGAIVHKHEGDHGHDH